MGTFDAAAALLGKFQELSGAASKPFTDRVANATVERVKTLASASVEDPNELLVTIALDDELNGAFQPVLNEFGFELTNTEIVDEYMNSSRIVSKVMRADASFYVINVPKSVLEQATPSEIGAISLLGLVFADKSVVYIISRNLETMALGFQPLMDNWYRTRSIEASFVSWTHVATFLEEKNQQRRRNFLKSILKLDKLAASPPAVPVKQAAQQPVEPLALAEKEKSFILTILTQIASNPLATPQINLTNLVKTANFPEAPALSGKWQGNPEQDAQLLLLKAENPKHYPIGHPREGQLKIGWLLKAMLDQELSPDDATNLAKIIFERHLINDPDTLSALQAKYSAAVTPGH